MVSFALVLLSFVYCAFLNIHFFKKQHIDSYENRLFGYLLIANFIGLILEMLCIIFIRYFKDYRVMCFAVNKLFLVYLITFIFIFSQYVLVISYKKGKDKLKRYYKITSTVLALFWFVALVAVSILPIELYNDGTYVYSFGAGPNVVYIISTLCTFLCIYALLKNFKKIINKKYTPIFGFILGGIVCMVIQKMNPALTIASSMETFELFLMFFSIENPDVKLISELNMARDQAEKANNAKTEFLSHMSHEVRTPLNAIINFSNSLAEELGSSPLRKDANYIVDASKNLLEIVNGILDISKIEAGKIEIVNVEYEVSDMLEHLVALSKARLGSKQIEFRTSFDSSLPKYLYGDEARIKQICVNLLTNSIKYTQEGHIDFNVSSVISGDVCRLIISVEDTGIGIKREDVDKLFDKFSRLDLEKNISIEGSGLGLAITKKLVDMMGGKIVVQSEYGSGTNFTVAIDQKIVAAPKKAEEDFDVTSMLKIEFPNKKILVIDDNKMNLRVAEKVLEPYKVVVETAGSGDEGIEKIIASNDYDLVLLDDMMPEKTGVETLKELKENFAEYKTPTIALTANAIVGMKEKYLSEGFDDYLAKPIEKDELKRVLNKYLK